MCSAIAKTFIGLTSVAEAELITAKAMLKGNLLRQLGDDVMLMQDMGTQLLTSGRYSSVADFVKAIDGVTEADLVGAARKLLASKATVVAYGDTHAVPHLSSVETMLKSA